MLHQIKFRENIFREQLSALIDQDQEELSTLLSEAERLQSLAESIEGTEDDIPVEMEDRDGVVRDVLPRSEQLGLEAMDYKRSVYWHKVLIQSRQKILDSSSLEPGSFSYDLDVLRIALYAIDSLADKKKFLLRLEHELSSFDPWDSGFWSQRFEDDRTPYLREATSEAVVREASEFLSREIRYVSELIQLEQLPGQKTRPQPKSQYQGFVVLPGVTKADIVRIVDALMAAGVLSKDMSLAQIAELFQKIGGSRFIDRTEYSAARKDNSSQPSKGPYMRALLRELATRISGEDPDILRDIERDIRRLQP